MSVDLKKWILSSAVGCSDFTLFDKIEFRGGNGFQIKTQDTFVKGFFLLFHFRRIQLQNSQKAMTRTQTIYLFKSGGVLCPTEFVGAGWPSSSCLWECGLNGKICCRIYSCHVACVILTCDVYPCDVYQVWFLAAWEFGLWIYSKIWPS